MRPVRLLMRTAAALFFLFGLFGDGSAAAQPANFDGRWILVPDPPAPGRGATGGMGSGWGADIILTQDAATLTLEYTPFVRYDMQPPIRFVYQLNGTESRNTINMGRGPQEQVSKTVWNGNKLVITTVQSFTAPSKKTSETLTSQTTQVLSLESPATLVVETTRSGVMGGPSSTTKSVYKKN